LMHAVKPIGTSKRRIEINLVIFPLFIIAVFEKPDTPSEKNVALIYFSFAERKTLR